MATGRGVDVARVISHDQKNMINNFQKNRGFSLAELIVSVGIFGILATVVTLFGKDIFSFNAYVQSDLGIQMESRRAIVTMISEMREMTPSSLGSYPIAAAATSSITFYSDIDSDSQKEQVRYYIQGTQVKKSVIEPSGSPVNYNGTPAVSTVVSNLANGTSTALFQYYDTNYAGTTTPLTIPVSVASVKLVKITMNVPRKLLNHATSSTPLVITSQVTIRNLKDNL